MTREEAIEVIKEYRDNLIISPSNQLDGDVKAFDMAIQALSSQSDTSIEQALLLEVIDKFLPMPCNDAISRDAVLDAVSEGCQELRGVYGRCEELINALPSVTPQSKCLKAQVKKQAMPMSCDDCCYKPNSPFCEMYRKDICEKKAVRNE